jgi:hypothetical protein
MTFTHTWTPTFAKLSFNDELEGKDCSHTSGFYVKLIASIPDGIRWQVPQQNYALFALCVNQG